MPSATGSCTANVVALARPPRIPGREIDYLNRDDLRRPLDACTDDPLGPLVTLAGTTGLRQGELLGLAWGEVDMDGATLTRNDADDPRRYAGAGLSILTSVPIRN